MGDSVNTAYNPGKHAGGIFGESSFSFDSLECSLVSFFDSADAVSINASLIISLP